MSRVSILTQPRPVRLHSLLPEAFSQARIGLKLPAHAHLPTGVVEDGVIMLGTVAKEIFRRINTMDYPYHAEKS